jgi:FkbM family methyltransferase
LYLFLNTFSSNNNGKEYTIGSNEWLLKEVKGATLFDKMILRSLKFIYSCLRIILRINSSKRVMDKIGINKKITFKNFLYRSVEFLHLDNSLLIVFDNPYDHFKFYSKITTKLDNFLIHDVYQSMCLHEEDVYGHFSPKDVDTVIDIGAAFGFYTIISSKRVGKNGKVLSIEASPAIFDMLNRNIKLNKLDNVLTLNYAVYSKQTKIKLYSTYSILTERSEKNTEKFVEVNADTLDNLLLKNKINYDDVNWIKIDVEGAEFEVLKGATNVLSKSKDISLLIEIHNITKDTNLYRPIMDLLEQYNFKIEFEKTYESGEKHVIVRKR